MDPLTVPFSRRYFTAQWNATSASCNRVLSDMMRLVVSSEQVIAESRELIVKIDRMIEKDTPPRSRSDGLNPAINAFCQ
jgi:hypothetical protein